VGGGAAGCWLGGVIPLFLLTGLVPLNGAALIPTVGITLGGTMTAVVVVRLSLDTLTMRLGEVEAAPSLGLPSAIHADW
jgi:putative ABC transport system permease protein